ncbi:hypothetical protein BpHYR1_045288 [Brachionus plicatilis]|uniref:Uncharacterized protein n=1 Tax=Brachionus plicatilis TaxID=10195 RepID=A0A3M7SNB6_BRAPC|nr:hypothetical protein BpHYR1_045288 [Brachionus plicatilis]
MTATNNSRLFFIYHHFSCEFKLATHLLYLTPVILVETNIKNNENFVIEIDTCAKFQDISINLKLLDYQIITFKLSTRNGLIQIYNIEREMLLASD